MKNYRKYLLVLILIASSFLKATTIPFELIDGKIVVNVQIKSEQHYFIFDTGAFTIISSDLRDQLNVKKSNIIFEGTDGNNAKSRMEVFTTGNVQLAGTTIKNVNFSFADVNWMSARACKKISGIFGANMMKDRIWRIDFQNKWITVSDKIQENNTESSVVIPFSPENFTGVPRISVKIRNKVVDYLFDTGSGMGFTLDPQVYSSIKDNNFLTFEGLLAQSVSSVSKGERKVDLMEVQINNVELGKQMIDSSPDSRNLLGTRFMENYVVDLDFIQNKIILNQTGKKPEYKTFGISLSPTKDGLIIVNKLQSQDLSELPLKEKITKVNNIDVSKVDNDTFCQVKNLLDNNDTITIESASGKKITLQKKNVLQSLN
jgi:predicted aspartyl protease